MLIKVCLKSSMLLSILYSCSCRKDFEWCPTASKYKIQWLWQIELLTKEYKELFCWYTAESKAHQSVRLSVAKSSRFCAPSMAVVAWEMTYSNRVPLAPDQCFQGSMQLTNSLTVFHFIDIIKTNSCLCWPKDPFAEDYENTPISCSSSSSSSTSSSGW